MAAVAAQPQQHHYHQPSYPSHSVMDHVSDDDMDQGDDNDDDDESIQGDINMSPDHAHFYRQQQQQAMYYQQHQQMHGQGDGSAGPSRQNSSQAQAQAQAQVQDADEDAYSDGSSEDSMPDDDIDFSLTYALHTFLATVEGQASVVKGDSLVLLDDANSYWWLVRVLKTEDVGYIPAENIETPYERLARLNKHRNVDLAAATLQEKQVGAVQGREKLKGAIAGKMKGIRRDKSGELAEDGASRRVVFAPPTYVDHPGVTWSSDEESGEENGDYEVDQVEQASSEGHGIDDGDHDHHAEAHKVDQSLDMEPDDGVGWADNAAVEEQKRVIDQKQQAPTLGAPVQPRSNNPFAPKPESSGMLTSNSTTSVASSSNGSTILDPADASHDTRRITATPAVAGGPLLPSAMGQQQNGTRQVSGQSVQSVTSVVSTASSGRSTTPTSPEDSTKKMKKSRKSSKEDLNDGGEKKKSRGMLGGLFNRKGKDKVKGLSNDPRSSEESMVSGAADNSPASIGRRSEELNNNRPVYSGPQRPVNGQQQQQPVVSAHGLRLQQQDQARMQSYTDKYLNKSPTSDHHSPLAAEAAAAVAQSAAAMRLAASMNDTSTRGKPRPSSVILSPNPAGPPLLNVIRIFAGDHIKSEASFKTALINETTSAGDLIRQAMQRFHLNPASESSYYVTVRDVNGEEMELNPNEKALSAFQEAVRRWASESEEDLHARLGAITPTIKRSSISSISSVASLSNHPAIAKLGMNDFSDDSTVKIYLNRRRPASTQLNNPTNTNGMPEPASEFSSYSTQLSTVRESSPEANSGEWSSAGSLPNSSQTPETMTPPTPQAQPRFNPSLTITTNGQASPERFSSPSARFTIQLFIYPSDLPDGSAFDPSSEAIILKALLRDRQVVPSTEPRRRLFMLPRNANVVEAVEQGLERFGIQEGVVDGGDEVEDKVGKRRSMTRVRYGLAAIINGEETALLPSSRLLEAYTSPPNLRPVERSTPEQRRRSRDLSYNAGSVSDILPSDPTFVLRRIGQRGLAGARVDGETRSPAEIIAAQRAASRANQKALISAQANTTQGVDIIVPDKGTFRSSRLMEGDGEVVRYSYIDGDGETYDISELLEEEWGQDGQRRSEESKPKPPGLSRMTTDSSQYVTAPSTPNEEVLAMEPFEQVKKDSDILRGAIQRSAGQEGHLAETLNRVINKVRSGSVKGSTSSEEVAQHQQQQLTYADERDSQDYRDAVAENDGRQTPSGRSTPQAYGRPSPLASLPEGRAADLNATPRASEQARSNSRQSGLRDTANSVNRIISRHRQQPSIASIMSDLETSNLSHSQNGIDGGRDRESQSSDGDGGSSTPVTATSSSHPTPPFSGAVFTRVVNSASPTPRQPVSYTDDFGMKNMMAVIEARAREYKRSSITSPRKGNGRKSSSSSSSSSTSSEGQKSEEQIEAENLLIGSSVNWDDVHPEIKGCFEGLSKRLEGLDRDIDELLAGLAVTK